MKNITLTTAMLLLLSPPMIFAETATSTSTTVTNVTTTPETVTNNNANATTTSTTTSTTIVTSYDTNIIAAVYDKYAKDPALIGTNLTVGSQNGVVSVSGTVTAQSQADQAVIAAKSVPGVKDVKSFIHVTTNPGFNNQTTTPNY